MHNATNWHSMLILINTLYDLLLLQATVLLRCSGSGGAAGIGAVPPPSPPPPSPQLPSPLP
jgi:hypothetical protein